MSKNKNFGKLELITIIILKNMILVTAIIGILEAILYSKDYGLILLYVWSLGGAIMINVIISGLREEIYGVENEKSNKN